MKKLDAKGEMPFLEHLEELRWRILWSLGALLVGTMIGFWLVQHFDIIGLLKRPIAQYLPASGRLYYTHPTDAFIVIFKLSLITGAVLASPVVIWQAWAFFSPALYQQEKRYIVPVIFGGLVLFSAGVMLAYLFVLPAAFRILLGFQTADFEPIITADNYFGFALQLVLAFGLAFELPLVIMLLAFFGVVTPKFLSANRRFWVVIAAVAAAVITPTPDALTMLVMMVPLILLYELGIILARIVGARPRVRPDTAGVGGSAAVLLLLFLGGGATAANAQQQQPRNPRPLVQDSLRDTTGARAAVTAGQPIDTAAARKMGLPSSPSHAVPPPDSVISAALARKGFASTRYAADSISFHADTRHIDLTGAALVEREGSTLEADSVGFAQSECRITASGEPKLFDRGTVLIGEGMRYDTCLRRGEITEALTKFQQSGVDWFLRGQLSIDSASTRIYAGGSTITSSDLPLPDYHFSAGKVKWVTNTIMVARPAVLYIRDVPVLWLPFLWQDMHRGRRSGILIPRFGINDLVRTNPGYRRHVSNVGYYWVINNYLDAQAALDWFAGTSVTLNGQLQYRWLEQFVNGSLAVRQLYEAGTSAQSRQITWSHQQQFNMRTRLSANVDYASSTRVLQRNGVSPDLFTATLRSQGNFSKQFSWGTFSTGGSRSQDLSNGVVSLSLPTLSVLPAPVNITPSVTWSPSFSFSNDRTSHQPAGTLPLPPGEGVVAESLFARTENSNLNLGTPFRIGRWSVPLSLTVLHTYTDRRSSVTIPDPEDSTQTVTRFYNEDFSTQLDWTTSLALPTLFTSTWKLQPSVGIANSTGGSYALRNRYTGGGFVTQGKRLSFAAGISPALFGFFPGIGPLSRIRHSVSPSLRWSYAPPANVPVDYARAINPTGTRIETRSPRTHSLSFGLSQTFEGKFRQSAPDTGAIPLEARKIKLLSLQTSSLDYDFEQAKLPGRNGWRTQTLSNQFTSDLMPGFSIATTHDLWAGLVGFDTTRFDPFLSRVSARFSVSANTVRGLTALVTGKRELPAPSPVDTMMRGVPSRVTSPVTPGVGAFERLPSTTMPGTRRPFTAAVTYDEDRPRANSVSPNTPGPTRTIGLGLAFSPTRGWSASWDTQYNLTTKEFGQHVLRLERDLRRWRAIFAFVKAPNGNFAFDFSVTLLDQQDIRFQYDQRTVNR